MLQETMVSQRERWKCSITLVSVTVQSKGQEYTAILASLTDVMSPSASFLNTMPCSMEDAVTPQP